MKPIKIAAFSGSLRRGAYTTQLINAFTKLAPAQVKVSIIGIGNLPFINEDLENDLPASVKRLHQEINGADAILLATPEYNRSYSPVLKNALDWGSRPEGKNQWAKKPAAVIGGTPHSGGAFGAQNHLRQVMMYLDLYVLQQPEFYLSRVAEKFNEAGELTDKVTIDAIHEFWKQFLSWIYRSN